jgi:tRNA(Met) cytidine acetyltransferase
VIRIAVHAAARGRGLGKFLLHGIVGDARAQNLDLVGSSFGATKDLLDFWGQCGFPPVHLGTSRNAASGAHAAAVLQPLSPAGESLRTLALRRLAERLPSLLTGPLRDLEPEIAGSMLCSGPGGAWTPDPRERHELETFAFALRPYEATLPLLSRLVSNRLGRALRASILDVRERDTLICKVLQQRGWGEVARLTGLTGKAQVTMLLRKATGKIIEHRVPGGPGIVRRSEKEKHPEQDRNR